MATWTVGPLAPLALPYADLGVGTAKSAYGLQEDAAFVGEFDVGEFILSASGSITVQADADNINPMLVRVYHRPGFTWHDLGMVAPGETETFAIEYDVTPADSGLEASDNQIYNIYFRHDPTGGNVRYTITDLDLSFQVSDVAPSELLLVNAASPSNTSLDVSDLHISNMLSQVTVNGDPLSTWIAGAGNRTANIELVGTPDPDINSTSGSNGIATLALDTDATPGTYTQPYRVRLYLITDGGEGGEGGQDEITDLNEASDTEGVVTFILTSEGGGGGPSDPEGSRPWWFCTPAETVPVPPSRAEGFVLFADYDADYKFPLASSRVPAPAKVGPLEEGCHGCAPEIISCES